MGKVENMVDPDQKGQDNAPEENFDDTKTRKTVVRPKSTTTPAGINLTPLPKTPLTDPLSGRDTDTGNLEIMEDTQTRRTVKLKPIASSDVNAQPRVPINPVPGESGAANTQTRRTIVLKPLGTGPALKIAGATGAVPESDDTRTRKTVRLTPSAVIPPPVNVAPPAAGTSGMANTQTRRTVKLKSSVVPPPTGGHAAEEAESDDTRTRKTVKLTPPSHLAPPGIHRPVAPVAPSAPVVPAAPSAGAKAESDDTQTRKTVRLAPPSVTPPSIAGVRMPTPEQEAEAESESSDTIKIARPPRPGSLFPHKPMMSLPRQEPDEHMSHSLPVAKPLPPQTPLPKPGENLPGSVSENNAVPHIPSIPGIPPAPAAPKAKPIAPDEDIVLKPAGRLNAEEKGPVTVLNAPEPGAGPAPEGADSAMPELDTATAAVKFQNAKPRASKLYLGLAVASLILVAGGLTLSMVQYLNTWRHQHIELPFLPKSK